MMAENTAAVEGSRVSLDSNGSLIVGSETVGVPTKALSGTATVITFEGGQARSVRISIGLECGSLLVFAAFVLSSLGF